MCESFWKKNLFVRLYDRDIPPLRVTGKVCVLAFLLGLGALFPLSSFSVDEEGAEELDVGVDVEEGAGSSSQQEPTTIPPGGDSPSGKPYQSNGWTRGKQAEGTKAENRFETETVVKSKYRFLGRPLEVDPD